MREYAVPNGMALSIFQNKYSRIKKDGTYQSWAERVSEVIDGNFLLDPRVHDATNREAPVVREWARTKELAVAGVFATSGRHLQHGDHDQPGRKIELHSNCATAFTSFMLQRCLLSGAGVGRDYSAAVCRVDWSRAPNIRLVLDESHPDFDIDKFQGFFEPLRDARHKYASESESVRWFTVEDTREGWSKVTEIIETAAWQGRHADKLFIFDFSEVRGRGQPIMGMQGRPASGPLPLMDALAKVASIKHAGMPCWKQALFIDHYIAACVHFGGARRAARMAVKSWRDRDIIDFIDVKRGGFLWSANNSILVDAEFWEQARSARHSHGRRVFEAAVNAAYFDSTGEPGFINIDKLNTNRDGMEFITGENCINPETYADLHKKTKEMLDNTLEHVKKLERPFLTNPCFSAGTLIVTDKGALPIEELVGKVVRVHDGKEWREIDNFRVTGRDQPMLRISMQDGSFLRLTSAHTMILADGSRKEAGHLEAGDRLMLSDIAYDGVVEETGAYLKGFLLGDGTTSRGQPLLWLYDSKYVCEQRLLESAKELVAEEVSYTNVVKTLGFIDASAIRQPRKRMQGLALYTEQLRPWCGEYRKCLPVCVFKWSRRAKLNFLAGFFDADGGVVDSKNGYSYQITSVSLALLHDLQALLKSVGVRSKIGLMSRGGLKPLPGGDYETQDCWRLGIAQAGAVCFSQQVIFSRLPSFADRLLTYNVKPKAGIVVSVDEDGVDDEVYCCTVPGSHSVALANGIVTGQCGEVVLSTYGGLCLIGDICLSQALTKEEALDASGLMSRFLVRCNLMRSDYAAEIKRTNRIGVSLTGIHEFAWNHFGLSFRDMIYAPEDPLHFRHEAANEFWAFIDQMRERACSEAAIFSEEIGMVVPHTTTCIKPSGTVSKVLACTEGAHLPALAYYLRFVQYQFDDPAVPELVARGYPMEDISHRYHNQVIVGFPTKQPIVDLMGDMVTTADETTPEENFRWLQLLEKHWLGAPNENGQLSFTLKYSTKTTSYDEYMALILKWQPEVRAVAIMPQNDWRESKKIYGYVPEQPITKEEYESMIAGISAPVEREAYDDSSLACSSGVCPIEADR